MALTDTAIRNAKPKEKPYKVSDSQGLYLLVNPRGSKLWRVKYRMNGVERKLALGSYPEITLAEARSARDAARRQLAHSVDPNFAKRQARIEASLRAENSFAKVAEELIAKREKEGVSPRTLEKYRWLLKLLGDEFGRRPVAEIGPANCCMRSSTTNGGGAMKPPSGCVLSPAACSVMPPPRRGPSVIPRNCC